MITGSVDRIVLRDAALDITLLIDTESATDAVDDPDNERDRSAPAPALTVSWKRPAARRRREIIVANGSEDVRPIRAETRATLVRSIAVGRRWLQEIVDGSSAGPDEIAARESCSRRHVMMMISLSFLAPDLVSSRDAWPVAARYRCNPSDRRTNRVVTAVAHARALTLSSLA